MCVQLPFPRLWHIRGRGEKILWIIFNSFFSFSLCPAAALSHPSHKWKAALTRAVSSAAQCALQKGQTPLPGNLGTRRRRRANVGKSLQWARRLSLSEWGLLRGHFPLLDAPGRAPEPQELPLTPLLEHIPWNGHQSPVQASCWSESFSQCLKRAEFLCSWAVVLGCLVLFPVCFGRAPGRIKIAGVEAAGSICVYKWRRLLCTATYLPEREGCSHNGDLTDCICFVLV